MEILKNWNELMEFKKNNFINNIYVEKEKFYIHIYRGFSGENTRTVVIKDLENAMLSGKKCLEITLQNILDEDYYTLYEYINENGGIRKYIENMGKEVKNEYQTEILRPSYKIYLTLKKGVEVYSPFTKLSKVEKLPNNFTKSHVIKLLRNKQFKNLECTGVYTDDYAFDNAYNFQKAQYEDGEFLIEKITNGGGWNFSYTQDKKSLYVSCYSFENYKLEIDLEIKKIKASNFVIVENDELKGYEVKFDKKPSQSVINNLKEAGFKWSSFGGHWYIKQSRISKEKINMLTLV